MDNRTLILLGGASVLGYMLLSGQQDQNMIGDIGTGENLSGNIHEDASAAPMSEEESPTW